MDPHALADPESWDTVFDHLPVGLLVHRTLAAMRAIADNPIASDAEKEALEEFRRACYII